MTEYIGTRTGLQPVKKKPVRISTDSRALPLVKRMIDCPNFFIKKDGPDEPFLIEANPAFKDVPNSIAKDLKIKKWKYKKDRNGHKIPNWNSFYKPRVSAAYAIENIYDPLNWVCTMQCKKRCMVGMGQVLEGSIKRLNG